MRDVFVYSDEFAPIINMRSAQSERVRSPIGLLPEGVLASCTDPLLESDIIGCRPLGEVEKSTPLDESLLEARVIEMHRYS